MQYNQENILIKLKFELVNTFSVRKTLSADSFSNTAVFQDDFSISLFFAIKASSIAALCSSEVP